MYMKAISVTLPGGFPYSLFFRKKLPTKINKIVLISMWSCFVIICTMTASKTLDKSYQRGILFTHSISSSVQYSMIKMVGGVSLI